jgi:hypothetical protein
MDIAETFSDQPGVAVPYLHYTPDQYDTNAATNTNVVTKSCAINPDQFNDYVMEWNATTVTILFNGQTCLIDHYDEFLQLPGTPFDQPYTINLTQALGLAPDAFEPGVTPLPATTEVQYVRAWEPAA